MDRSEEGLLLKERETSPSQEKRCVCQKIDNHKMEGYKVNKIEGASDAKDEENNKKEVERAR